MSESYLELADVNYLTPENAVFYRTKNGFPAMRAFLPPKQDDLEEKKDLPNEWQDVGRVWFHRAFPFDVPEEFISVLDKDGNEYGLVKDLKEFASVPEQKELIESELARKYLMPKILKINSLKSKIGYSYWEVETDVGKKSFTMQDTYRNMFHHNETGVILTDSDGNRYEIADTSKLDPRSYRKIELYL